MELPANPSALVDLLRAWFFAKDRSLVMADNCFIEGDEISTPGNPISGRRRLYAKDDCWYDLDSNGTETSLCDAGTTLAYAIIADEKASGTNGGTFTNGAWRTRDLNVTRLNTITGYSLAANQFTLPAGNYILVASVPAHQVSRNQARLQNITDGATVASGTSMLSNNGSPTSTLSVIIASFNLTGGKVLEVQHQCETTVANTGFGISSGVVFAVTVDVYTEVLIIKYG